MVSDGVEPAGIRNGNHNVRNKSSLDIPGGQSGSGTNRKWKRIAKHLTYRQLLYISIHHLSIPDSCHPADFPAAVVVVQQRVGVAGLHRLLARKPDLDRCVALVVAAGMEGALPSVVGGLVGKPVVGLPTSVGYGASMGGLAALLAMLNSCAPNVTVVNVDNGFGAGFVAGLIARG